MGKPAARLGDPTAHGGTITGPGCPTVLIGGMPAATLGDMHVCPMATPGTPPIPHVGGPISLGSTGVFIGGKPAARMGDMAVCVGPPSTIIMGCPTVLIGEVGGGAGGGGGGGGAGSGGGSAAEGSATSSAIAGQSPQSSTVQDHFLDVSFVDQANLPIGGIAYEIEYPDNTKNGGVLGGSIKRNGVPQGSYSIKFRGILNAQWSVQSQDVGSAVDLIIDTIGIENGTAVACTIFVRDSGYCDHYLASVNGQINGNQAKISWMLQVDEKLLAVGSAKEKNKKYSQPFFFYRATIAELSEQSGLLYYKDWIEYEIKDDKGNAIANRKYTAVLPTGEVRQGTLDANGTTKLQKFTPGKIHFSLE